MVAEVKRCVLVVFISKFMNPGNDVGWSGKGGECMALDTAATGEV